jgi:hypothetical protein
MAFRIVMDRLSPFVAIAVATPLYSGSAAAQEPATMMQMCRSEAATTLKVRMPDVETKYEGQRTDGTHAVNGTAYVAGQPRTFQCSFNRAGSQIIHFVVNPVSGQAPPTELPSGGLAEAVRRAGQGLFDANGAIPCATVVGQPMAQCRFGVARAGGGTAAVVIDLPGGGKRVISFERGRMVDAGTSQADVNVPATSRKEADLNFIQIGAQRFEIPDAVMFGG